MRRVGVGLALVVVAISACDMAHPGPDADVDASATDAAVPDDVVLGLPDATRVDANVDAGLDGCVDRPLAPWDLALGHWSHDYGPRGLSFDGYGSGVALGVALSGGTLYVAGHFTHAGPIAAANVATWTPTAGWQALGDGVEHPVGPNEALGPIAVAPDGTVYVGGYVPSADALPQPTGIYRYAAGAWSMIGMQTGLLALAIDADGTLLAGGVTDFARWNGTDWTSISPPQGVWVEALTVDARGVCIGGTVLGPSWIVACRAPGATTWTTTPLPQPDGPPWPPYVVAIAHDASGRLVVGGAIYPSSSTTQGGGVMQYDGSSWGVLGIGLSGAGSTDFDPSYHVVHALAHTSDDALYAAGSFTTLGPSAFTHDRTLSAFHVARFASGAWQPIGGLGAETGGNALALATAGAGVFVGGAFDEAYAIRPSDTRAASGVVAFDGTTWSALAHPGAAEHGPRHVSALAARGSCAAAIGGPFDVLEDRSAAQVGTIAADGTIDAFTAGLGFLNDGTTGPSALAVARDGTIYAATSVVYGTSLTLARLRSGHSWESFATFAADGAVLALDLTDDGTLYVGGRFVESTTSTSHLARWDGTHWSSVGAHTPRAAVSALTHDGNVLYVAELADGGGTQLWRVDGDTWTALGAALPGDVSALATYLGDVIAAGSMLDASGAPIVRFDGTHWSPMGTLSTTTTIEALAILGDTLVAGGETTDTRAGVLVRWSTSDWMPLADGVDGPVSALAFTPRGLFVGGHFDVAGHDTPSWGLALLQPP